MLSLRARLGRLKAMLLYSRLEAERGILFDRCPSLGGRLPGQIDHLPSSPAGFNTSVKQASAALLRRRLSAARESAFILFFNLQQFGALRIPRALTTTLDSFFDFGRRQVKRTAVFDQHSPTAL